MATVATVATAMAVLALMPTDKSTKIHQIIIIIRVALVMVKISLFNFQFHPSGPILSLAQFECKLHKHSLPLSLSRLKSAGPINPITLDPSTLESYANVQMANAQHPPSNTTNVPGNNNDIDKMNAPFTIQGYSDRYTTAKENHSEISC